MFLASKIGWARIAFTLLMTGVLVHDFPRRTAASDSHEEGVAAFVMKDEITKMQETLRAKGYYAGKIDGVFGLRTRAGVRAYQKAENLPIAGRVETRTAEGLGIRPESSWDNSQSAARTGGEVERGKPSANIK